MLEKDSKEARRSKISLICLNWLKLTRICSDLVAIHFLTSVWFRCPRWIQRSNHLESSIITENERYWKEILQIVYSIRGPKLRMYLSKGKQNGHRTLCKISRHTLKLICSVSLIHHAHLLAAYTRLSSRRTLTKKNVTTWMAFDGKIL